MATPRKPAAKTPAKKPTGKKLAESPEAQLLQKLLLDNGAIDMTVFQQLADSQGLTLAAKGLAQAKYSRIEKQRQWLTSKSLSDEEKKVVSDFAELAGTGPRVLSEAEARDLSQTEIDALMREEQARRQVEDVTKGDYQAIRATVLNVIGFRNPGEATPTGRLSSPTLGYRFSVINQDRTPETDYSKLEDVLDPETWEAITEPVTTREVNEQKLAQAIADKKVTDEHILAILPEANLIQVLRVDPIKPGDAL